MTTTSLLMHGHFYTIILASTEKKIVVVFMVEKMLEITANHLSCNQFVLMS